jgi:hypothetical protein
MNPEVQPSLLVMTATINPQPGAVGLDRTDPALRMKDYCEALDFYLSKKSRLIDRIVFVENSHSDLSPLQRLAENNRGSKQVEFVSFYGLDYPPEYIRGYGEFKLLDYAFHNSRLLTQLKSDDKWWKVTGRYRAVNIDSLVRTAPRHYDMYADFRFGKHWVDVRLLSFSRSGYERLILGRYHEMAGLLLEKYFYDRFGPLFEGKRGSVDGIDPEFRVVPRIEGIGGWRDIKYMSGTLRMRHYVRSTLKFLRNLAT